jgi:demethylmenaquinone methyltransferase/2-methoxy-6-polyprenyl-1,4-benzoquinol methylase
VVVDSEMRGYYDRRAPEYDDWWLGRGLYAELDRPGWDDEVERLVEVVAGLPAARVLDVACGTGFLTCHLRGDVTGLDQSPAMVDIAAAAAPGARIVHGDAVPLPFADRSFDRVFTGHFYGHLLEPERAAFLAEAGRVADRLVVVDSALRDGVAPEQWQTRRLSDGSDHRVYKRYFSGPGLADELGAGSVLHAGRWFVAVEAPTR